MDTSGRRYQVKSSHWLGLFLLNVSKENGVLFHYPWYLQVGISDKDRKCRTPTGGGVTFFRAATNLQSALHLKPFKVTNKLWESSIAINKNTVA